jgi:glycosyltransferase involved in cell wall biosynthesis
MNRILLLIPSLGGGGAERQITYLARGLAEYGCLDVHVGIVRGGPNLQSLRNTGATVHWIASRGNYDPLMWPRILRLIHRIRPDVVQTYLTQMDVLGGAAALLCQVPWIVSERSSGDHYPRDLRHTLRRIIGRRASAVISNSKGGLSFWKNLGIAMFVVPNAIPTSLFEEVSPPAASPDGTKLIVFAGRLDTQKNLFNLIDALAVVVRKRRAVARVCGVGPEEGQARARIDALGLSDRISLSAYDDDLWGLMKRADVFVSVSWFEGHPNVVLEAAACECPLVLSDIDAHREFLDGASAAFASPGNVESIVAAVMAVLDDPAASRLRAVHAREVVRQFSINACADAHLRVYETVLASARSTIEGGRSLMRISGRARGHDPSRIL